MTYEIVSFAFPLLGTGNLEAAAQKRTHWLSAYPLAFNSLEFPVWITVKEAEDGLTQNFSIKGQAVNTSDFADSVVSAATPQLFCCTKATTDNTHT